MTRPLEAGDGRIKVLWLDDTIDRIAPWGGEARDYEPWFSLVYASHPKDVQELVDEYSGDGPRADCELDHAGTPGVAVRQYDAPRMPFDVYLVDFRMCDNIDEGCSIEEHIEEGLHAPSAGFLVGMLTALRWPKHPQAIIPYSGYDEEFGQIWRLTSRFCPPVIDVLWDDSVTKGSRNQRALLKLIPRQCREALLSAIRNNAATLPLSERDRWHANLEGGKRQIPADEEILIAGEYGVRPFLIGALFHDHLDEGEGKVPAKPVREWLKKLPVTDPLEPQARRLAEFYWNMRWNEVSEDIYTFARAMKDGKKIEDLPDQPPSIPWLCSRTHKGDTADESIRRLRLAVLFLILREHEYRVRSRRIRGDVSQPCRNLMRRISYDLDSMEEVLESLREESWSNGYAEGYNDLIAEFLTVLRNWPKNAFRGIIQDWDLDVSEAEVVRLVDPFPPTWDITMSLDKASKIGKGLSRLRLDGVPALDVKALLGGDASCLTPSELLCARQFARELSLSETDWPRWLRGGE